MNGSFAFLGPNGNLKAQSSQNIELGVDYTRDLHGGKFSSRLAWFQKDGKDTLDSEIVDSAVTPVFVGFMGPGALTQNFRQAVNRDETVIKGWEATCRYDTTKWYANASFSAISGENVKSGDKLNTIPGDKVTLECGYFVNDDITLGARGLWVSSRENKVQDDSLKTSGYDIYGLFAEWKTTENMTITAGVHNLLNQEYERTNVAQVEPGRSFYVSANYNF